MRRRTRILVIVSALLSWQSIAWSTQLSIQDFLDQSVDSTWKITNGTKTDNTSLNEEFSAISDSKGILHPKGLNWIGTCFDPKKSECTVDGNYMDLFGDFLSPEQKNEIESTARGVRIHSVTKYRIEGEKLIAICRQEFFKNGAPFGNPFTKEISISISSIPFKFAKPTERGDSYRCSDFERIPTQVQALADSVVQIIGKSHEDGLGEGGAQGSGFFISESGFLLTNHHVIHAMPAACIESMKCSLHFRQILGAGKVREFDAPITLETESKAQDFALLKVELPAEIKIRALDLETEKTGPEVFTVGYPSDRQAENGTALTYSSGYLDGMMGTTVKTNAFIADGASGSPLLSSSSLKAIGIMSNTVEDLNRTFETSLARPISSIEKSHQISQYLTGEKQQRIDKIIEHVIVSSTPEEAQRWMNAYEGENTLYGISKLEEALYLNASSEVRKVILQGLQKQGMIRGSLGE
jgi:hypothetical protein